MRFKRISTDTVRCIITQDELKENGLDMDDFLSNNGRTEEFLRKMIAQAEQVGFKVQGGPLTIQVAVLPENKLALTFSEKQAGNLMELLEGLRSAMSNLSQAVHEKTKESENDSAGAQDSDHTKKELFLLEFADLKSLQAFCKNQRPCRFIKIKVTWYVPLCCSIWQTVCALCTDTSCSVDLPPYNTAIFNFSVIFTC